MYPVLLVTYAKGYSSHSCLLILVLGSITCPPGTDLAGYAGNVSVTNWGKTCQRWADQSPHTHYYTAPHEYEIIDGSITDANNYCRNVYGLAVPWCITTDPDWPTDNCDESICSGIAFR